MLRTALLAVPLAALVTATEGTDFEPDGVQVAVVVAYVVGLVVLGVIGGWRGVLFFAVAYAGAAIVHEAFFWNDDPSRSGIDDMSPTAGFVVVLPFALPLLAAAALAAELARRAFVRRS